MADGDVAQAQLVQALGVEDLVDQAHILVAAEDAVVVDHDAGALLAAVL